MLLSGNHCRIGGIFKNLVSLACFYSVSKLPAASAFSLQPCVSADNLSALVFLIIDHSILVAQQMADKELALHWEKSSVIRSRFRREISWLQWPVLEDVPAGDEENEKQAKHPVCTKSIELNADALLSILEYYDGGFAEISKLQSEARI